MRYQFSPDAKWDLFAAAEFYESQHSGLGVELAVEIGLAIAQILETPGVWPQTEPGIHRFRIDRFPYALVYRQLNSQTVEIIGVFDLRSNA